MIFTGGPTDAQVLQGRRERLSRTYQRLWTDYFALGGNHPVAQVEDWLTGSSTVPAYDYDLLAHALNEAFTDLALDHPIPYSAEI